MTLDLQSSWASLLMGSFADAGVTNLVISPGSRSTPFVLAALREPRLQCTDAIDERTAAFFALGLAKATGRPSLLLCTSGSAGAHYLPAVIEAAYSHTPLLILTADRPFELQSCGAAQTIDQTRLFGTHARAFVELGLPDGSELALRALPTPPGRFLGPFTSTPEPASRSSLTRPRASSIGPPRTPPTS
jgi:2-succinyl-5-enolpyruvyl-6-hydroxy-3-cyclohexene-1-carboxylate synthase